MWHLALTTQSGVVVAFSALFGFLPQAVLSVFGGVWADRVNRKRLVIAADSVIAATTLALALLMIGGVDSLWLIYITLAIRSAGAGIQGPAVSALLPQITPTRHLMRVNGINGSIQTGMMLLAPAAAAALYASTSIVTIFFIDVATALIGIALLATISVPTLRGRVDTTYAGDLVEGVRYVAANPFLRWLLVLFGALSLLFVAPSFLTPLMVVRTFGDEVWKLALTELVFSVGMLVGNVLVAAFAFRMNRVLLIMGAAVAFGVLSIAIGLSTDLWLFLTLMLIVGIAMPVISTPALTLVQEKVEPERQGRVFGLAGIVMSLAMPIGMVVVGPLADLVEVESILIVTGGITFLVVAAAVLGRSGRRAVREGRRPGGTAG